MQFNQISSDVLSYVCSFFPARERMIESVSREWKAALDISFHFYLQSQDELTSGRKKEWEGLSFQERKCMLSRLVIKAQADPRLMHLAKLLCGPHHHTISVRRNEWDILQGKLRMHELRNRLEEDKIWVAKDFSTYIKSYLKRLESLSLDAEELSVILTETSNLKSWPFVSLLNKMNFLLRASALWIVNGERDERELMRCAEEISLTYKLSLNCLYEEMAVAFSQQGDFDRALTCANQAGERKERAYLRCAEDCAKRGDFIFSRAFVGNIIVDINLKDQACMNCVKAFALQGDKESTQFFIDSIEDYKNRAYVVGARSFAELGDFEHAQFFADGAGELKDEAYASCAKAFAVLGDFEHAQFFADGAGKLNVYVSCAEAFAKLHKSAVAKVFCEAAGNQSKYAYSSCAQIFAELGNSEEAWTFMDLSGEQRNSACVSCAIAFIKRGESAKFQLFIDQISSVFPKDRAYQGCARELAILGDAINAMIFIAQMQQGNGIAYRICAKIFAERGDVENARAFADKIVETFEKNKAYAELAKIFAERGEVENAQCFVEQIELHELNLGAKEEAYLECAEIFAEHGNSKEAKIFADQAGDLKTDAYERCKEFFRQQDNCEALRMFAEENNPISLGS
ncbi:Conserved hypothetical protein [Candidatus Protochlamydia naegleriophila]|uniref:Uncharacterized protein n=1 Tax=Candidatus Protochlamydia naegleriophila TaxID=389348 RepID=A0A0U5JC72_9BACT|nr:Conserved hypothetical protein [Candidatus Protochlamydia naegleriophila]